MPILKPTRSLLLFSLAVSVLLGLLPGPARAADAEPEDLRLTKVEGSVLYRPAGATGWVSAKAQTPLQEGDRVKTLPGAKAEIASETGDLIELDEKAEFAVRRAKKAESAFDLVLGRFMFNVLKKPDRKFTVKTPLSSIAIRGTEFAVYQAENDAWEGGVIEGKLAVSPSAEPGAPPGEEVMIAQDEGFLARKGQKITRLVGLPPRVALLRPRFAQMRQRTLELRQQWRRDIFRRRQDLRRRTHQQQPR